MAFGSTAVRRNLIRLLGCGPLSEASRPGEAPTGKLRGDLRLRSAFEAVGFAIDAENLQRRFVVECCLDDYPFAIARADLHEPELDGFADGCYGFAFAIPDAIGGARLLSARIANTELAIGNPIDLANARPSDIGRPERGEVAWIGGLRLRGWIEPQSQDQPRTLKAFVDGPCVARASANQWTHRGEVPNIAAMLGFDIFLPSQFADGRVHRAHVIDDAGRELPGSPCVFIAFEDGLARFLERLGPAPAETLRGELYDKLIPQSIPFEEFERWKMRFPLAPLDKSLDRIAVALIGEENIEASIASLEAQEACEWIAGSFTDVSGSIAFQPNELIRFLAEEALDCAYIAFARSGTVFDPCALNLLTNALASQPRSSTVYSDVAVRSADGSIWPLAFPAFDYERTLEQGYASFFFAARRSYVSQAINSGARDLYRVFNFGLDQARRAKNPDRSSALAVHLPGFLAILAPPDSRASMSLLMKAARDHCEAVGVSASINLTPGGLLPAVRIRRTGVIPSLTIVVPTHNDRPGQLQISLESLLKSVQSHDAEILVVSNGDSPFTTGDAFSRVRHMRIEGPYSFVRCANAATSAANGELLLFLGAEIEATQTDWLDEMLSRMIENDVGAVAPMITGSDGFTRGAGDVLGMNFSAEPAFRGRWGDDKGYGGLLSVSHECSAIGAIGMLTRRNLFRKFDGFAVTRFPRVYAATDYCLRLRADGHRVVIAPFAKLTDHSVAQRDAGADFPDPKRPVRELATLRAIWGHVLMDDPYYNPLLSLDATPFSALAWPPRPCAPRLPIGAPACDLPLGF